MGDYPPSYYFKQKGTTMARLATSTRDEILTDNRQKLLQAAAAEIAQKGFAAANINQISLAAGFAKGTIYNYFSGKRELMLALIDEVGLTHTRFIVNEVEMEANPTHRLTRFFSAGFDYVKQYPIQSRIAIHVIYGHDNVFKQRIYAAYTDLFALLIDHIVTDGIERGEFKPVDADMTAGFLMSLYLGSCSQIGAGGNIWFNPDQVASFVLEGLRER